MVHGHPERSAAGVERSREVILKFAPRDPSTVARDDDVACGKVLFTEPHSDTLVNL